MTARWKFAGCWLLSSLAAIVAPSCNRAAEPPTRLPNQIYNRMVYVRTDDASEVFVNMPGHWDLGSPSISPDGKSVAFDALTVGESPSAKRGWSASTATACTSSPTGALRAGRPTASGS